MKFLDSLSLLTLVLQESGTASLPETERKREAQPHGEGDFNVALHLGNCALSLDNYNKVTDLSSYEEFTDYGDHFLQDQLYSEHYGPKDIFFKCYNDQAATWGLLGSPTSYSKFTVTGFNMQGIGASAEKTLQSGIHDLSELPNASLKGLSFSCMCLGSSVCCNDTNLESIPGLPQITAYLYTCFNHIHQIQARDFKGLTKLKRVDLSSNFISSISDNALYLLPALQDLILPDNQLAALPRLPTGIEVLDICLNWLQSWGIKPRVFTALEKLPFLYLAGNLLDSIPGSIPLSLCSLHLQNNMIETMQSDTFCDQEEHKQTQRQLEDYCLNGNPSTCTSSPAPISACYSSLQATSPSSPQVVAPGRSPKAYPPKDFLPGVNQPHVLVSEIIAPAPPMHIL